MYTGLNNTQSGARNDCVKNGTVEKSGAHHLSCDSREKDTFFPRKLTEKCNGGCCFLWKFVLTQFERAVSVIFVWVPRSDFWCGALCFNRPPRSVVYACVGWSFVCVRFVCRTCWTLLMQAGGTGTRPQIDSVEACRNGKRGMWIWNPKPIFSVPIACLKL